MNKIMTVKFEKDIGISDEEKNKLRYTLVLHFMEQLKQKGMYKVEEEKHDGKWVISASLVMPTIEAEPDNGWISVKDRLPEIKEHYRSELVICYSPDGEHECLFDYYEINGFGQGCFTAEKYFGITITHWRHLPEPPKGE